MSEDTELLPDRERARVASRDRKLRGPKVVMVNPGLRQRTLELAARVRIAREKKPNPPV